MKPVNSQRKRRVVHAARVFCLGVGVIIGAVFVVRQGAWLLWQIDVMPVIGPWAGFIAMVLGFLAMLFFAYLIPLSMAGVGVLLVAMFVFAARPLSPPWLSYALAVLGCVAAAALMLAGISPRGRNGDKKERWRRVGGGSRFKN